MRECSKDILNKDAFHSYYEQLDVDELIEILEDVVVLDSGYKCGEYGI